MRKKSVKLQNLNQITTYFEESGIVSEYFNVTDFPEEVPTGRSSFLILGSSFLKENVNIKIEVLDNQGNPVYIEPVFNYEESNGVRVSLEVYDDVSAGTSTLTILGEVDPAKIQENIPPEFQNVYNVKYTRNFVISKDIPNTRPIRFYKRPGIGIQEVFRAKLNVDVATSGSLSQSLGTVTGVPVPNSEGRTFEPDSAGYGDVVNYTDQNLGYTPIGNLTTNIGEKYQIQIAGAEFSSSMQGGTITIANPVPNPSFITQSFQVATAYSSSILEVLNKNTITVQKPFGLFNSSSREFQISALSPSNYEIVYPKFRTYLTSSIDFKSFAEITVHTMRTFSGDVYRLSAYVKDNGPVGNWIKIADTPIESPELLVNPNSTTGTDRLGFFRSDSVITSFYDVTGGTSGAGSTISVQTASDPEYIPNSLFVSGSGVDMLADSEDTWIKVQLKPQYSASFIAGNEYVLRGKFVADNRGGSQSTIKAVAHFSGSAFNMSNTHGGAGYGRAIGLVSIDQAANQLFRTTDPSFEFTFTPDRSGTGVLQLRFTGGHWHVSDLSLRPASETNFSPDIVKLTAPIPTLKTRPDNLDFAIEFYDINNNKSETVITSLVSNPDGIEFLGENMVIAGNDSTIEGSLFLGGDSTGSGIQFGGVESTLPETGTSGASGSGFIRSLGYRGFTSASLDSANTGFMIYSGSVLPDSGDLYDGVGLELVGLSGSLRFSTIPSRFEVQADAFFVGNKNLQFISGSQGNIEISSSAFHLSRSGDVVISGSITATDGFIGNWQIVDGKLSGSNATLDANGAALFKSDQGPDTNPLDGFYIDFTPENTNPFFVRFGSNFAVSSSGTLIASGAVIEGVLTASAGFIANWIIGSDSIHKSTGGKFTGLSSIGDTRFFGGAASLNASGSAPFNVKSTGDITGSSVLFTGGKIGGFVLTSSEISSSGLLLKSSGQITGSNVLFDGGKIGGFEVATGSLKNTDNTVELDSALPGLKIKDALGVSRVEVKSGSLSTLGGGTQYIGNKSFEVDTISAGRNLSPTITSWSYATNGHTTMSLTKRSGYPDDEKAVSGDVTLDVVVPSGAGNYATNNTYEIVQVITSSISAGDTLSFSSVARFSSSFGGRGKDRALGPQYFRMEYWNGSAFVPFLPASQFTASNGYGEYFLGSGQYNSFGASAEIPAGTSHLKLILTGSINDDSGFTIQKPLFVGDKGEVNSELSGKTFTKSVVGSTSPEFPETEITFDNFSVRSNTRRVEMTQEGLLIYNSEDSFFKMTGAGIEFRGGSGLASFGQSINRESFTNDSQIAGTLAAPSIQAYTSDPEDIGTTASDGNVADFAKGNHRHRITFSTINSVLSGETLTGGIFNGTFGSSAASDISGSFNSLSQSLAARIAVEEAEAGGVSAVTAGSGLSGGGTGAITIDIGAGTGIDVAADAISVDVSDFMTNGSNNRVLTATGADAMNAEANLTFDGGTLFISGNVSSSAAGTGSFGKLLVGGNPVVGANVAGNNTEIQFNNSGDFGASSNLTFNGSTLGVTGNITVTGNVDGRDVSTDGSKLDGIEAGADVTDTANVTSAGALMDSEVTNLALVKKITDADITGSFTAASSSFSSRLTTNTTKLDGIEAGADVTDTANVTSAGALMDSELASEGTVKKITEAGITGSFTAASSSFSSRVTTNTTKLDGIESGATADQTASEIRALVESASDSNVFTDTDHSKLDGIEASADVTDATNVAAAGALMDSELASEGTVKKITEAGITGSFTAASASFSTRVTTNKTKLDTIESGATADQSNAEIRAAVEAASDSNVFTDDDHSKLDGIEASADVTDTANVTAAGALMDSEVDADIKTLSLPASTTISSFGATLVDDADAGAARTTLGLGSISTLSSIDISSNTNLVGGTNITLDGDTLNVDDAFLKNNANDTTSGTITAAGLITTGNISGSATSTGSFAHGHFADSVGIGTNSLGVAKLSVFSTTNTEPFLYVGDGTPNNDGSWDSNIMLDSSIHSRIRVEQRADNKNLEIYAHTGQNPRIRATDSATGLILGVGSTVSATIGTSPYLTVHGDTTISGNITVTGTVDGRDLATDGSKLDGIESGATADQTAGDIRGLGFFDTSNDGASSGLDSDLLDGQHGSYYLDFGNFVIDNDEIPIAKLASDNVNFGGVTVTLGGSDTTPAFDLSDATSLPIVAGTTGTLSVARGGTGATSLNNLITLGTHTTGNYVASLVAGTGIDLSNNSGESATPTIAVDVSDFLSNGVDNRVVTATSADGLNGEDGLTFDGNDLGISRKIFHIGDTDTFINFTEDNINIQAGGVNFIDITQDSTNEITFNEEGADVNVRMEGDNNANLFFLDAGNDRIGIGTNSPTHKLHVVGNAFIDGALTAREFYTDVVSSSISYTSGSNKFGDSSDDKHQFTGSVDASGSVSVTSNLDPLLILNKTGGGNAAIHFQHAGSAKGYMYVGTDRLMRFGNDLVNPTLAIDASGNGTFTGGLTATTLNTGQGANELYAMNQDVETSDSVTFAGASLSGGLNMNANTITLDSGETIFATGGYVVVDGNSGFIIRDDGSNRFIANGNTFRGDSNNAQYLGSSSIRFANVYGVLGNFSSNISLTGALIGTGDLDLYAGGGTKIVGLTTSTISLLKDVTIADGESIGTTSFTSGFVGSGYRIDQGITESGKTSATFDNLTIRGTMSIFEMQIQQIRATNGNLFISSTGKVDTVVHNGGVSYTIFPDSGSGTGHGFAANDIIRMQRFDNTGTGGSVTVSDLHVQSIAGTGSFTANLIGGTTAPAKGFEYVRLGNSSNANRQGGIYLTADDDNAPFIDVFDNITSHADFNANTGSASTNASSPGTKVRIGKLDGVTSARFGAMASDTYGMWASGSVFLEGNINAKSGNIGNWGIGENAISSSNNNITIDASTKRITINDGSNDRVYLGEIVGSSTYGLRIFDGTGTSSDDIIVDLGPATNRIAGWEIIPGRFQFNDAAGSIALDATNKQLAIYTGSINTAKPKVVVGNLPTTGTAKYGFAVFSGSSNADINDDTTYSVLITKDEARLAGWDLIPGRLSSGTVAKIDGNNATIALGTNATTHTTASPSSSLFFVSASADPIFFVGENFSYISDVLTAGGWKIGNGIISSSVSADTDGVILDATNKVLTFHGADGLDSFHTSRNNVRLAVGQVASNIYGLRAYDSSGNALLSITDTPEALIAGWTIGTAAISKNDVKLDSTAGGEGLYVKKTGFADNTAGGFLGLHSGTAKFNVGDGSKFIKFDGSDFTVDTGNFSLDSSGNVTATNANLAGTVTATAGQIGGFGIAAGAISSSNNNFALSSTHASMSLGGKVKIAGGTDSFIAGGGHFADPFASFDNDATGFVLGMDNTAVKFELNAGDGDNSIVFDTSAGTPLAINAQNFTLGSTNFRLTNSLVQLGTIDSATDTNSSETGFFVDSSGNVLIKTGTSSETGYMQFNSNNLKIKTSNFEVDGGTVTMTGALTATTITANTTGTIAGWTVNSGSLTKTTSGVGVSFQNSATYRMTGSGDTTNVIASGLVIKDDDIPILSVVSASKGQTPISSLLPITGSSGTISDQHKNNAFTTGNIDTGWSTSNSNWTNWVVSSSFNSFGTGNSCVVVQDQVISAGQSAGTTFTSTLQKDFDVTANTMMSVAFVTRAFPSSDPRYATSFGDIALFDQELTISLFPLTSGTVEGGNASFSGTAAQVRKIKNSTLKPTKVNMTFKNGAVSGYRLEFKASAAVRKTTNAAVKLGGWSLERVDISNISAPRGTGARAQRAKPLVELSQDGLLVFSDENNFLRVNDDDGFTLRGNLEAQDLDVSGELITSGSVDVRNGITISGSLTLADEVGIAMGVDRGESRVHIKEEVGSSSGSFFVGTTPSWRATDGKHISSIKAQVMPYTGTTIPGTATFWQTAFGAFGMRPSYNFPNYVVYGEGFHGGDLDVPEIGYEAHDSQDAGNDMSASVGLGKIYTFVGSKQYIGFETKCSVGPLAVNATADNFEEIRWWGGFITHDTSAYKGPSNEGGALDSGGNNSGGVHTQVGILYIATGSYHEQPTVGTGTGNLLKTPLAMAAFAAHNQRGGNFGQKAGWGLAISGSHWNNFIEGPLGVGGNQYPSGSQQLHVTGHILATGNITAFSDVKHKDNIDPITGSIEIVNNLRGVRFNWKKDYIKSISNTVFGGSEDIHRRQIGLIAQEVEEVLPELVTTSHDKTKNVNYQNMVAVLIEANKEQQRLIEDLQKRVEKLEAEQCL